MPNGGGREFLRSGGMPGEPAMLSARKAELLEFVATYRYVTNCMSKEFIGVKDFGVIQRLLNEFCEKSNLPKAILSMHFGGKAVFYLSPEVKEMLGRERERQFSLFFFTEEERKAIGFVMENPYAGREELAESVGMNVGAVRKFVTGMCERCLMFDLPQPLFIVKRERHFTRFVPNPEFALLFGLKIADKPLLEQFFTERQMDTIRKVEERQWVGFFELADALEAHVSGAFRLVERINQACARDGLPEAFESIGGSGDYATKIALSHKFSALFGLKQAPKPTVRDYLSPTALRLFNIMTGREVGENLRMRDLVEASEMREGRVRYNIRKMRERAEKLGEKIETHAPKPESRWAEFSKMAVFYDEFYRENGRWPRATEVRERHESLYRRIINGYGSVEKFEGLMEEREAKLSALGRDGELMRRLEAGDESAKTELMEKYLPMLHGIVKKYSWSGLPNDVLVYHAMLALEAAVRKFDYWAGVKFSTYAHNGMEMRLRARLSKPRKDVVDLETEQYDEEPDEDGHALSERIGRSADEEAFTFDMAVDDELASEKKRIIFHKMWERLGTLLTQQERTVFILKFYGNHGAGMEFKNIASLVGIEPREAGEHYESAVRKLGDKLAWLSECIRDE